MQDKVTALVGGSIIDGTGKRIPSGTILIEGDRISAVGPSSEIPSPRGATVRDLRGHTLLPGLIDCHVHLNTYSLPGSVDFMKWNALTRDDMKLLHGVRNAKSTLQAGITTVRSMGTTDPNDGTIALRDAIATGVVSGPRVAAGQAVRMTGSHGDTFLPAWLPRPPQSTADGPDEVRKAVRNRVRNGADFIKISTSGGAYSLDELEWRNYTLEEVQTITEEAHALGRLVASHSHTADGTKRAILGGVDSIEHGTILDDECIELLVSRGVYLVPTLAVTHFTMVRGSEGGIPEYALRKIESVQQEHVEWLSRARKAGVKVAMGTDAAYHICRCGDNATELELMGKAGFTPMEAIEASTRVAAENIGWGDKVGTLQAGKLADILIVWGDPLADIRILQNEDAIRLVIQGGKIAKDQDS